MDSNLLLLLEVVCNVFLLLSLEVRLNQHAAKSANMFKHCINVG